MRTEVMDHDPENPHARRKDDAGGGLVEYALLITLIFLAALASVTFFAEAASSKLYESCDAIANSNGDTCT
jgi:Flp pilus assembly pilin Flp